jgi:hypothetical protein
MIPGPEFPRLTAENHRITSPATAEYNCVAWSAGDTSHWWQPGVFWPVDAPPNDFGVGVLAQAFAALGFADCEHGDLEAGFEKVALYRESAFYTHIARQLPDGKWTSKLGRAEDIEHETPEDLAGGVYGVVVQFMSRALPGVPE